MNLRDITRDRLSVSQVEQLTSHPVDVVEDSSLQTTAVVLMASRRTVPTHIVRYNPATGQPPDYSIYFTCAFSLRLFANPPQERFECSYKAAGCVTVGGMVQAHLAGLRPNLETEDMAMKVVVAHEPRAGRSLTYEKNLGYDITSLDLGTGELRSIEVNDLTAASGTNLLSLNERRVAEYRRDCFWLHPATNCVVASVLQ